MDNDFRKFIIDIYLPFDIPAEDKIRHVNNSFESIKMAHYAFEEYKRTNNVQIKSTNQAICEKKLF